jgi:hypothetical protein
VKYEAKKAKKSRATVKKAIKKVGNSRKRSNAYWTGDRKRSASVGLFNFRAHYVPMCHRR